MNDDREAFLRYYEEYRDRITTYFWYRTGFDREAAEDCTQDVFLKALRAFPSFDAQRAFGPWIYRIAHNHLVSTYRSRRTTIPLEEILDTIPTHTAGDVERRLEVERVLTALTQLDPRSRELLHLRAIEEYSYEEMADILGKRTGAVRVAVHRARAKLERALAPADAMPPALSELFARV